MHDSPSTPRILAAYAAMCLMWGSTWVMIKIGLNGAPPLSAVAARFLIAAGVGAAVTLARRVPVPRDRRFLGLILFLGVVQQTGGYVFVYYGERSISSGLTAVLFATMPFVVAIFARIILGDRLTRRRALGMVAGAIGVWIIFADQLHSGGTDGRLGVALVLCAVCCASLSTVVVKRWGYAYDPMLLLSGPILVGGFLVSIAAALVEKPAIGTWTPVTWMTIVYLAIFGSVAGFTLLFWVIRRANVTVVAYQTFIIPIIAMVFGWVILGEAPSRKLGVGIALVLSGVIVATVRVRRPVV